MFPFKRDNGKIIFILTDPCTCLYVHLQLLVQPPLRVTVK